MALLNKKTQNFKKHFKKIILLLLLINYFKSRLIHKNFNPNYKDLKQNKMIKVQSKVLQIQLRNYNMIQANLKF